ncbi:MAG: hypothetical protein DLM67_11910 [Candidatus Nephthysia bennettiae]|nr:MAG: hypothetical protein DLM67_11910 [Candidatus Dormibacteraeota bacterium]
MPATNQVRLRKRTPSVTSGRARAISAESSTVIYTRWRSRSRTSRNIIVGCRSPADRPPSSSTATRWPCLAWGHDHTVRVTCAHPPPTDDRLGAAVGFGFAALESSGYAMVSLVVVQGQQLVLSLGSVVTTALVRGVLAPFGHGIWSAIVGGAIFAAARRRGRLTPAWSLLIATSPWRCCVQPSTPPAASPATSSCLWSAWCRRYGSGAAPAALPSPAMGRLCGRALPPPCHERQRSSNATVSSVRRSSNCSRVELPQRP